MPDASGREFQSITARLFRLIQRGVGLYEKPLLSSPSTANAAPALMVQRFAASASNDSVVNRRLKSCVSRNIQSDKCVRSTSVKMTANSSPPIRAAKLVLRYTVCSALAKI